MNIVLYSNKIDDYLKCDNVIDYDNEAIIEFALLNLTYWQLYYVINLFQQFCYQKLILDDEIAPVLIYHGLNGVYIKNCKKWIRLDARGNKTGVNAQFSIEMEQLAFPIRPNMGELDSFIVYPDPDIKVLEKLRKNKTRTELWDNLPTELGYNQ